jgi:putative NADH-flavin reductase
MEIETVRSGSLNILVFGANGGIGSQVVAIALQQGHRVTAVVRNTANIQTVHDHLTIVKGDVLQPETFGQYLEGKDAVISAIGKSSLKKTTLYSQGVRNILMAAGTGTHAHFYFISASGLDVNPTHNLFVRFATRYILQRILKNMYTDLFEMERIIKHSNLDWTIVRPPRLIDSASVNPCRFSINTFVNNGLSISRTDLARFILDHIRDESFFKSTVEVAY